MFINLHDREGFTEHNFRQSGLTLDQVSCPMWDMKEALELPKGYEPIPELIDTLQLTMSSRACEAYLSCCQDPMLRPRDYYLSKIFQFLVVTVRDYYPPNALPQSIFDDLHYEIDAAFPEAQGCKEWRFDGVDWKAVLRVARGLGHSAFLRALAHEITANRRRVVLSEKLEQPVDLEQPIDKVGSSVSFAPTPPSSIRHEPESSELATAEQEPALSIEAQKQEMQTEIPRDQAITDSDSALVGSQSHVLTRSSDAAETAEGQGRAEISQAQSPRQRRERGPDLATSRKRMKFEEQLRGELTTIAVRKKKHCTLEILRREMPDAELWKCLEKEEDKELLTEDFFPKKYARHLVARKFGVTLYALKKDRAKLRKAGE